jgi:hypothetical protein
VSATITIIFCTVLPIVEVLLSVIFSVSSSSFGTDRVQPACLQWFNTFEISFNMIVQSFVAISECLMRHEMLRLRC